MKSKSDFLTLGVGFFALLFGAGNLLFPPLLGLQSGSYWWLSISAFIISDILFALFALYLFTYHTSLNSLGAKLGNTFITAYSTAVIMIFALFILPRTASMTYELSIEPFISPDFSSWIFYCIYFGIVLIFALKESRVFDNLGKYFGPVFMFTIFSLIIIGIIKIPSNMISNDNIGSIFNQGFVAGYQTADLLGVIFQAGFAATILKTKGYTDLQERGKLIFKAGLVCIILFISIYFGLAYIGAKMGNSITTNITPIVILKEIAHQSLGNAGAIALAFTVFITCFTTTIGILGIVANFMADNFTKKITYPQWAIIFSICGVLIAQQKVDFIIKIAAPILLCVYPLMICLILLELFKAKSVQTVRATCFTALFFSIIDALGLLQVKIAQSIVNFIPLGNIGFVWVLPSIIILVLTSLINNKRS